MTHHASPDFWTLYHALPVDVQRVADRAFQLLNSDPRHPSLHFKRIGGYWSARVGLYYRVLGIDVRDGVLWFWIGSHAEYDVIVS